MRGGAAFDGGGRRAPRISAEVWVLLVVLTLTTGGTLLATARYGIGMNSDSVEYQVNAQNLANGLGYTRDGLASTIFPPGYSTVLAAGERLGVSAVDSARLVAVGAFACTTLLGFVLLRRHVRSPRVVMAGTVVVGCSAVLLSVFETALSEHLFIVVVLLLLLASEELAVRPRRLWLLAGTTVLLWAAFYLRYAGLVLVVFMALVVLITAWPRGRLPALVRSGCFAMIALSVPVLWMIRNIQAGSGAMGDRRDAEATLLTNVARTAVTLAGWLSFQGPAPLRLAAFLEILAITAALVVLVRPNRAKLARRLKEMWPLALLVVLYLVYVIGTASIVAFAPIYTRYLIPVFVPLVVLGAWIFERVQGRLSSGWRVAVTTFALAWIASNVVWFGAHALESQRNGAGGYSAPEWHTSRLMEEVEQWDRALPLVTNDFNAIQLFTGRQVRESVSKTFIGSNESADRLSTFIERVRCEGHIALVWFSGSGTRTRLYSPEELSQHLRVVPIVERADGVIYDLAPLPSSSEASSAPPPERPCEG